MRPTIKQISQLANVSEGTVDRVINNRGKVKPATKEKIEKIISEVNYKPNLFARNLALDPSFNIAVIIPCPEQDGGYWSLPRIGIDKAYDNLYHFRLKITTYTYDKFLKQSFIDSAKEVLKGNYDGVLLAPIYQEETKWLLDQLPENVPYVIIDTNIPGLDFLTSIHQDSYHGGTVAAQLMNMIVQNPSSVAMVRFLPDTIHINQRINGFKDYLAFRKDIHLINTDIPENCSKNDLKNIFKKLYISNKNLKGIFASTSLTFEVAQFLEELNVDMKIYLIGFDLVPENIDYMKKGIIDFLISQNPEQQGYEGIYSLYKHLVIHENVNKEITIPIEIITKENLPFYNSEIAIKNHGFNSIYNGDN